MKFSEIYKKKIYKELTIKLEIFTHIVPIPAVIYFSTLAIISFLDKFTLFAIISLITSTIFSAMTMLIGGTILRYNKLKKIFSIQDKILLKNELIKLPKFEALLIIGRWSIGILFAYFLIILSSFFGLQEFPWDFILLLIPFLGIPIFLSILPIEGISHYLISENIIRKYLKKSFLKEYEIIEKKISVNLFYKILFALISLVGMPMIMLISLMILSYYSNTNLLKNPFLHFVIISLLCLYPVIQSAYYLAKNIKDGLKEIEISLFELAKGNFNVKVGILTNDEIGFLAQFTNQIIIKLKEMYESIKILNENLENMIELRTQELKNTLQEVKNLKDQQDGDYFLTSLLLDSFLQKDLNEKEINSAFYYKFLVKQKKDFEFRNKKKEIGGDFCNFSKIYLKNKTYLFFVNADAMGKSIQGAVGSLLLSSLIQSTIERNHNYHNEQDLYPEQWLKKILIDLHKTFETFQGSMMVSLIMGLADPSTNTLYYINCEHPDPILIRNHKGEFLKGNFFLRKIGSIILEGKIVVHTIILREKDIFICGSDGKDDIIHQNQINEDPYLFIEFLKNNDYDVTKTFDCILSNTSLKDDISILWIQAKQKNRIEKNTNFYFTLREEIKKYYQEKQWQQIYKLAKGYLEEIPIDNYILYLQASSCLFLEKVQEAKDIIEVLILRNPQNLAYLKLASKIYNKLNLQEKAQKYYEKILTLQNVKEIKTKRIENQKKIH